MRRFGLIGFPLTHSWSEKYFTRKFLAEGITDASYSLFELRDISGLPALVAAHPGLEGFNVTIPYKERVIPFLDDLSPEALSIGAVNVVLVSRKEGRAFLTGHNTDAQGFRDSLPVPFTHKAALILGTGGAARAVARVMKTMDIPYLLVSRTRKGEGIKGYGDLDDDPSILKKHTFIVNATPAGMFPRTGEAPPLPYGRLTGAHFLYDLVYNPEETLFLRKGAGAGASVKNGTEMFTRQAEATYRLFMHRQ